MSAIIVEQNPRMILPITQHAVVLDRGTVVHRSDSPSLLADPAQMERWLAVAKH
jgi:branched-chain amino acid transport system ATP-binding protein